MNLKAPLLRTPRILPGATRLRDLPGASPITSHAHHLHDKLLTLIGTYIGDMGGKYPLLVESPNHGILKHIHHEATIGDDRSHETKPYAPLLRHLRCIPQECHIHHSCPRWLKSQEPMTGYTKLYDDRHQLIQALVLESEVELLHQQYCSRPSHQTTIIGSATRTILRS